MILSSGTVLIDFPFSVLLRKTLHGHGNDSPVVSRKCDNAGNQIYLADAEQGIVVVEAGTDGWQLFSGFHIPVILIR